MAAQFKIDKFDTTWREWHFNILTDDYISPTLTIVAVPFIAGKAGAGVGTDGVGTVCKHVTRPNKA